MEPIVLTGIRPTSNLTIANYIGAILPILEFQKQGIKPYVFVADLHALTDNEPEVLKYGDEILVDLLASGVNPNSATMYKQSHIAEEISILTLLLSRHVSVAELLRLPTLKEKVKSDNVENANALLLSYPVMMAADILIQRANVIPVGKDQTAHIELTRKIARRFNKEISEVFPVPHTHVMDTIKIMSLRGEGKMSKSNPDGAIFLTDNPQVVKNKIKKAVTANPGEMSEHLESHLSLIKSICTDNAILEEIDLIISKHMNGSTMMSDFKEIFTNVVVSFLSNFQVKRYEILDNKGKYFNDLKTSSDIAINGAQETIKIVYDEIGL